MIMGALHQGVEIIRIYGVAKFVKFHVKYV